MFKLIGVILIIVADFLIVIYMREKWQKEIKLLIDMTKFTKHLTANVKDLKMPIYESVIENKGKISTSIDEFIEKFQVEIDYKSIRESLVQSIENLANMDDITKKEIKNYFNIIAKVSKEEMEDYFNLTIHNLENILKEKQDKYKKTQKVTNSTIYALSGVVIILLI